MHNISVIVHLYARPGAERLFRDYETVAADVMERYGGVIEKVITPIETLHGGRVPSEIHLITFPSRGALALYRSDPDLERLSTLREEAIEHTEIFIGDSRNTVAGKEL